MTIAAFVEGMALSSRWVEVRLERRGRRLLPTEQVPGADVLIALLI